MQFSLATLALLAATALATPLLPPTTPSLAKREDNLCGNWSNQAWLPTDLNNYKQINSHKILPGGHCMNTYDPEKDKHMDARDKYWFYIDDRCDYCTFYSGNDCNQYETHNSKTVYRIDQSDMQIQNTWPGQLDSGSLGLNVIRSFSC